MIVDGENLIIPLDAERDEIMAIFEFIKPRIEFIKSISGEISLILNVDELYAVD